MINMLEQSVSLRHPLCLNRSYLHLRLTEWKCAANIRENRMQDERGSNYCSIFGRHKEEKPGDMHIEVGNIWMRLKIFHLSGLQ